MNIRQVLATSGVATMIALAVPGIAAAHNATATPSCGGLSWNAFNYDKTQTNSIVVTVDGTVVHSDPDFKASDSGAATWSQTANHTWSVVVDGPLFIGDDGKWHDPDRNFSGTWQECVATTTTTAPSSTTVVAPTTTSTTAPVVTTTEPAPTTSVVAVDIPPVPTTTTTTPPPPVAVGVDISTVNPALPATGIDPVLLVAAFTLVGFGGLVAFAARRRVG